LQALEQPLLPKLSVGQHHRGPADRQASGEPTLGVVVGDEFFFVANSHWNRFDAEANLPAELTGPIVLKLSLE